MLKEVKSRIQTNAQLPIFLRTLFAIIKRQKFLKHPSTNEWINRMKYYSNKALMYATIRRH
jgi:hypothetical protein